MAQGASGLHFRGAGHGGPARGVLASCAAEGMEVGAEHKITLLAQRNAQATQGAIDPGTLGDTAAVRGEVPQLVEQRVGGSALAAIGVHHEGGKVVPARPMQGIPAHLFLRAHFGCGPRGGRGTLDGYVSATVNHGSVRQQEAILEDGQDVNPGTSGGDGMRSCDLRAVWLQRGGHSLDTKNRGYAWFSHVAESDVHSEVAGLLRKWFSSTSTRTCL